MTGRCVTLSGRHVWEKLGLDVRRGRLVRVRRCSCCGAAKTIPYGARP